MERKQAIGLLKEIVAQNLVRPSLVALTVNKHNKFDLMLKGDCDVQELREFVGEKALAVKEDEEKGFCIIYKP